MVEFTQSHSRKPVFAWPVVAVVAAAGVWGFVSSITTGRPDPIVGWAMLVFLVVVGPVFVASLRLRHTVTGDALRIVYRPIWRRTIPLDRIERAEPTTYRPIAEYLGWGIRWSPSRGWAYTLSGDTGVVVHLRDAGGTRVLLGTPDPEPLAEAINRAASRG